MDYSGSANTEAASADLTPGAAVAQQSFSLWRRWILNSGAILTSDTCVLAAVLVLVARLRFLVFGGTPLAPALFALLPAWWLVAAAGNLLPGWGLSTCDHLRRQVSLLTGLFGLGAFLTVFTASAHPGASISFGVMWLLAIVLVPLGRMLVRGMLCARGLYGVRTVIFGNAEGAAAIGRRLLQDPGLGYLPIGICAEDGSAGEEDLPVIGSFAEIKPLAPAAIIVSTGLSRDMNAQLIHQAVKTYRKLLILPDLGDIPSMWVSPRDLDGTVGLEISQTLLSPFATAVKRTADVVLTLAAAPLWVPLCWLICLCIVLEDWKMPVFRQSRAGLGGRLFYAYKFRTMVTNAEAVLQKRLETDSELRAEWNTHFKLRRDPRITRVGRFLRRTSLDELPQLFNVLSGEMALVGPRPLPLYHLDRLPSPVREHRARMCPGMTGLWQVSGRSDAGTDGMARWDPYYVRNWSIWLDIVILVRTIRVVILGSGAR